MCTKVAFSKEKAHTALRLIAKQGKQMRAYQCDKCFKYHLTSDVEKWKKQVYETRNRLR